MGLPEKFDNRLRDNLGLRAIWLPGTEIDLGDVLHRKDGIFEPIANLRDFNVRFNSKKIGGRLSLAFQARGVSSTVVQAGAEVDLSRLDVNAKAELKIEFKKEDTYFIRTPRLTGVGVTDLMKVGQALKGRRDWRHGDYYIAWRVYRAGEFLFLGSQGKNKIVRFGGLGSAILNFLAVGASAEVARLTASSVSIELIGEGGPVAMRVARVRRNGRIY